MNDNQRKKFNEVPTFLPIVCIEKELSSSDTKQIVDWGIKQSKIPETWKETKGEGIKILVIDTGHPFHEDTDGNTKIGENFIANEAVEDFNGHQSHCTGIICAKNNKFGMVGVAPKSTCISAKALNKYGSGTMKSLGEALEYAVKTKPDIVSMSLGAPQSFPYIHQLIKKLYNLNIPVVCAAGNSGNAGVNFPAKYEETISVAAYDINGNIAGFSSKGPQVDWAAPGVNIYSTFLNNAYARLSGTSMACPFVVGIIALMLAKHRKQEKETGKNDCKTVDEIREHLLKYTIDKGAKGKDNYWGYGIIDVKNLIDPKTGEPKPKPEPEPDIPHPYPDPKPKPRPKESWIKKNLAWVVLGSFVLIALLFYLTSIITKTEKIYVPWITEDGEVLWDEKMEWEENDRR